ncbi:MAG: hypothetical protein A2Z88_09675 [Omnitrophica WOR_2 bacterium GWA2_47_8]|nr:MAG: hypothetical protein A2Z88_09675 [Omnitrophica WOR_2 bacterium GWA2_47_8]
MLRALAAEELTLLLRLYAKQEKDYGHGPAPTARRECSKPANAGLIPPAVQCLHLFVLEILFPAAGPMSLDLRRMATIPGLTATAVRTAMRSSPGAVARRITLPVKFTRDVILPVPTYLKMHKHVQEILTIKFVYSIARLIHLLIPTSAATPTSNVKPAVTRAPGLIKLTTAAMPALTRRSIQRYPDGEQATVSAVEIIVSAA